MLKSMTFRATLASIACAISLSAHAMADTPKKVEIPPGALRPALLQLSKTFGVELVYQPGQLRDFRTRGVEGTYTPEAAVRILLKGTPLELRIDPSGAMLVAPPRAETTSDNASTAESDETKEGKKSSSEQFLVAQVDQGKARGDASVENERTTNKKGKDGELQEVVVTGRREFLSADTSGTTNLPIPIEQVPQSISLVSNDFIEAADLKTLANIAEYTPGAINAGNQENTGTLIKLRGFSPGRSIDGVNVLSAYGTYFEPDFAIYDRLEIVKGPSSVVYGISSPGGLVNYVTKSATPQTPDYLLAQAGSWSSYRLEGQIAGALDADGHVRAIGIVVRDQGNSFLNVLFHKETSVYGGLNFDLGSAVTAYIHGGYQRYETPSYDGTPTEPDGSPAPLPRSFWFGGSPWLGTTTDIGHTEGDLTWHASDVLDLSIKGNYQRVELTGAAIYSYGLEPSGDLNIGGGGPVDVGNTNYGVGISGIYKFDNLGLKNSFVSLAALYQSYDEHDDSLSAPASAANIFDGQGAIIQAFDALVTQPQTSSFALETKAHTLTISMQSILQVIDPLSVLLGVSYSKAHESTVSTYQPSQDFPIGGQTSYRAGITYELLPKTYAYASYSQSFNPQTELDINQGVLPPIIGEQYEVGVKRRDVGGRLLLTAAAFQIREKNVGQVAGYLPNGNDYFAPIGEVTNKGLELQALGQITPQWQVNAGYAYLSPKITGATSSQAATVGETQLYLPEQTFSLYSIYTLHESVLRGLSFGGGVHYVDAVRTSYAGALANMESGLTPTKNIPGYTVVDLNLGYSVGKWSMQLNAHNVFDRHYYINNYQTLFYGNVVGAPANVALSVRRQF